LSSRQVRTHKVHSSRDSLDDRTQPWRSLGFLACYPEVVLKNQHNGFINFFAEHPHQSHQHIEICGVGRTGDCN